MKHLLSVNNLTFEWIEEVMELATSFDEEPRKMHDLDQGKIMATLFYEPSTRTRLSFETSMLRLGGKVISVPDMGVSSSKKGETLSDTARMVSNYADAIVVRHSENYAVEKLAEGANVSVINAGDGSNEHPSQALLDLYTIRKAKGNIEGLKVALVGDLKYGRTVHSLSILLAMYGANMIFISPQELGMPEDVKSRLQENNASYIEMEDLNSVVGDVDVLYQTRVQEERFESKDEYIKYRDKYVIDSAFLKSCKEDMIIMHPLPRIVEITPDVDSDKRAYYFKQAENAVPVRMAIVHKLLNPSNP